MASALAFAACSFNPGPAGSAVVHATAGAAGSTGAGGSVYISGTAGMRQTSGAGGTGPTFTGGGPGNPVPIPAGYTMADIGAYKLGAEVPANGGTTMIDTAPMGCYQVVGVVRDFQGCNEAMPHPDFEHFSGGAQSPGLVAPMLGADRKPVYASQCESDMPNCQGSSGGAGTANCPYGPQTTTKANYDEWYRTIDGVNKAYEVTFVFEPNGKTQTFESNLFFPLDGSGWGLSGNGEDGKQHDFGFTTELHTKFIYQGGEVFTFTGDDDLWAFVNGHLALDLGGLHPQVNGTIDMDMMATQLGITKGNAYDLEVFHAERHTQASHFRVDTNFVFVDCGTIIP
jgi:fibro-slime domain-containing protein